MGKKPWKYISFSSTRFCYYRKHHNNDNKICPLPSFSCFQQHFHDWFCVLWYNSDLSKLEWALLTFKFNYIHDLTNRRSSPFQSLNMLLFHIRPERLKLIYLVWYQIFLNTTLKQAQLASFSFLSPHIFTTLEFDSIHFGTYFEK